MLKVWQIPVEMELDYNIEQIQKEIEDKYKERYIELNNKYQGEIFQLQNTIKDIQDIIIELNN